MNLTHRLKAAVDVIDARIKLLNDEDVNSLMDIPFDPWVMQTLKSQRRAFEMLVHGAESVDVMIEHNAPKEVYSTFLINAEMVLREFYGGNEIPPSKPGVKPWPDRR